MEPWILEALKAVGPIGIFAYLVVRLVLDHKGKAEHKLHEQREEATGRWQREIIHAVRDASQAEINHLAILTRTIEENQRATKILYDPEEWRLNVERIGDLCKIAARLETKLDELHRRRRA